MSDETWPVQSKQLATKVNGVHLEVLTQRFTDRVLVLITQVNKVGFLYQVSAPLHSQQASLSRAKASTLPELQDLALAPANPSFVILNLLGASPDEHTEMLHHLYATQVASIVLHSSQSSAKGDRWTGNQVIVGLALKRDRTAEEVESEPITSSERSTFAAAMRLVLECSVW